MAELETVANGENIEGEHLIGKRGRQMAGNHALCACMCVRMAGARAFNACLGQGLGSLLPVSRRCCGRHTRVTERTGIGCGLPTIAM